MHDSAMNARNTENTTHNIEKHISNIPIPIPIIYLRNWWRKPDMWWANQPARRFYFSQIWIPPPPKPDPKPIFENQNGWPVGWPIAYLGSPIYFWGILLVLVHHWVYNIPLLWVKCSLFSLVLVCISTAGNSLPWWKEAAPLQRCRSASNWSDRNKSKGLEGLDGCTHCFDGVMPGLVVLTKRSSWMIPEWMPGMNEWMNDWRRKKSVGSSMLSSTSVWNADYCKQWFSEPFLRLRN